MGIDRQTELLSKAELSIWLDSYNDIYSDFDSRAYNERVLSDDFIYEVRKMAKEKPNGKIELKLLMPADSRNSETETVIVKSLHAHFRHFAHLNLAERRKILGRGLIMLTAGLILLASATYFSAISGQSVSLNIIRVILEPGGWFLAWSGLENVFYKARKMNPDFEFNNRMGHSEIRFLSF